jgi:signal transduction histidine kinase
MHTGKALSNIRSNIFLTAVLTRDYLLGSDPSQAERYASQLASIGAVIEENFRILEPAGQPDEQAAVNRMRREFQMYWDLTAITPHWSPSEMRRQRAVFLRQRMRHREELFALAAEVERLAGANYFREREHIAGLDREFRASLAWTSGIALLLGFGIAVTTLVRILTLERQSAAAESELRRLTGQIRTAQEQERKFLSRELHDQVGQMLTGLRMELAGIGRAPNQPHGELASAVERAKGTVEQALRVVRNIAMLLRPSMLDDLGLAPALEWLVKELSRSSGVEIHSDIDPAVDSLPDAHRTCLYRVVQEALTNATRHSGASRIEVCVWRGGGRVHGTVTDDGRGLRRDAVSASGLGLIGMEERAIELGGELTVDSSPGRGARIEVCLPCADLEEGVDDHHPDRRRSRDRTDGIKTPA